MREWLPGLALLAAGCLSTPPESVSIDAGGDSLDAGADPCDGVPSSGCALFSCEATGSCYRLCVGTVGLADADCSGGSRLLETETRPELDCVRANNDDAMWLGLVQGETVMVDEAWAWQSSGQPPEQTFWDPVEPNDDPNEGENYEEQCAVITSHSGEWADVPCDADMPSFVCEFPGQ